MVVAIPPDYDVNSEQLDVIEQAVRTTPGIDLNNWGKFRTVIHTGTERRSLHFAADPTTGRPRCTIPTSSIDEAFIETGNANYEIIRSLYCMGIGHAEANAQYTRLFQEGRLVFPPYGLFCKSVKDFYFHCGCMLDSFGRLIFIFNDPAIAANTKQITQRRRINWGTVVGMDNNTTPPTRQKAYANTYINTANEDRLEGIKNVRNLLTHSWKLPKIIRGSDLEWPANVRSDENFPWWHEDTQLLADVQNGRVATISIIHTIREDYQFLIQYQSAAFEQLRQDVAKFEARYFLEIKNVLRP
jgi:hypothetical protein